MFFTNDIKGDYERVNGRGAEFTMPPTDVTCSTIAMLKDTCGYLVQLTSWHAGRATLPRGSMIRVAAGTAANDKERKMDDLGQYTPGPASGARIRKNEGDKWTLILVRELRHPPEKVWQALTDPAHLREWAPFDVDGSLGSVGTVKLTWIGTPTPIETKVTRVDPPKVLEYGDNRWELEPFGGGTRLTLWSNIDRRFISWGAAGWHIAFDVLDRLLSGTPIGRLVGGDAMKMGAWQRLVGEYAKQFGAETPNWPPKAEPKS